MWYILAFGLELMLDSNLNIDEWLLDLPYDKSSNHLCARIKLPPRTENRDGGFVMQGFADILPRSDTECRLSLGFPRDRGQASR